MAPSPHGAGNGRAGGADPKALRAEQVTRAEPGRDIPLAPSDSELKLSRGPNSDADECAIWFPPSLHRFCIRFCFVCRMELLMPHPMLHFFTAVTALSLLELRSAEARPVYGVYSTSSGKKLCFPTQAASHRLFIAEGSLVG